MMKSYLVVAIKSCDGCNTFVHQLSDDRGAQGRTFENLVLLFRLQLVPLDVLFLGNEAAAAAGFTDC